MAKHWTSAQIQTALAKTTSDLKPYELNALADALTRVPHTEAPDGATGTGESTLAVIFPNLGLNP